MKSFFGNLFGKKPTPHDDEECAVVAPRTVSQREQCELYKKGDVIGGKFEILGTLGKGGFGVVLLVHSRDTGVVCALKTFRDELLADPAAREGFKKEALLWVNLDTHPFIIPAWHVDEVFGRLFVAMEHIVPDAQGRVTLADHLASTGGPFETSQALKWGIQFCLGMEHARAHGIEFHRDIKPDNILITQDGTLKITDFGLASAAEVAWRGMSGGSDLLAANGREEGFGFSLMHVEGKVRCGTPGYMAPEVYRCEGADARGDIYSFGLVLWQMAAGSRVPPFMVPWRNDMESLLRGIYEQQMSACVPPVKGPLEPIIERCLRPRPSERYASFQELREALESIWEARMGTKFEIPQIGQATSGFWINKGYALHTLGRYDEAVKCYDEALAIDARRVNAWHNKANTLQALRRNEEAIRCYENALAIDPRHAHAWSNMGSTLDALSRCEEAIGCYDKSLEIDPQFAPAWYCKANAFQSLGRYAEAIECYDKVLEIDPRHANAWNNKGPALQALGRHEEAIDCYDRAVTIDPLYVAAWNNKGNALDTFGRRIEAIECYDKALEIDPRCTDAWTNKGAVLQALGRCEEAIGCYDEALAIAPQYVNAWFNKALAAESLGRLHEATKSYREFIELAPPRFAQQIALARQRLHELAARR